MPATYDDQGNYVYPDGFDSETGEWLEGYETQREEWEQQYAEARSRFEAHRRQITEARNKAAEDETGDGDEAGAEGGDGRGPRRSSSTSTSTSSRGDSAPGGALASDEALAALRDKLSGQS
jgi:small subunit ribosomal protein S1